MAKNGIIIAIILFGIVLGVIIGYSFGTVNVIDLPGHNCVPVGNTLKCDF